MTMAVCISENLSQENAVPVTDIYIYSGTELLRTANFCQINCLCCAFLQNPPVCSPASATAGASWVIERLSYISLSFFLH